MQFHIGHRPQFVCLRYDSMRMDDNYLSSHNKWRRLAALLFFEFGNQIISKILPVESFSLFWRFWIRTDTVRSFPGTIGSTISLNIWHEQDQLTLNSRKRSTTVPANYHLGISDTSGRRFEWTAWLMINPWGLPSLSSMFSTLLLLGSCLFDR